MVPAKVEETQRTVKEKFSYYEKLEVGIVKIVSFVWGVVWMGI